MILKKFLKSHLIRLFGLLNNFPVLPGFFDLVFDFSISRTIPVNHGSVLLNLSSPNGLVRYRIKTFSDKSLKL